VDLPVEVFFALLQTDQLHLEVFDVGLSLLHQFLVVVDDLIGAFALLHVHHHELVEGDEVVLQGLALEGDVLPFLVQLLPLLDALQSLLLQEVFGLDELGSEALEGDLGARQQLPKVPNNRSSMSSMDCHLLSQLRAIFRN
jgi:hypothetical protein